MPICFSEAVAGQPFRTVLVARDSRGRQAGNWWTLRDIEVDCTSYSLRDRRDLLPAELCESAAKPLEIPVA